MKNVNLLALAAIVCLASSATAVGPAALAPSSKWVMSGEDGRCILSRNFAEGSELITLTIEPLPLDEEMILLIRTLHPTGRVVGRWGAIGSGIENSKTRVFSFDSNDGIHRVHRLWIKRSNLSGAAQSGALQVAGLDDSTKSMAVPGLSKGLGVLFQCEQTIIENVGLTKDEIQAIAQQPEEPQVLYRRGPEYFELSAKGDLEDFAIARYIVDANGRAANCGIIHVAKSDWLNREVCAGFPEKFRPAIDKNGRKVRGLFFVRAGWRRREEWKGF